MNRKKVLKKVGEEILGSEFSKYAVLDMKDVSYSPTDGFVANQLAGLIFGPLWSLFNLFAALRAYNCLSTKREVPVQIVYMTLVCKGDAVPKEAWDAFYERNSEAKGMKRPSLAF